MTTKNKIWGALIGGLILTIGGLAFYFKNKNQEPANQDLGDNKNTASQSGSGGQPSNTGVVPPIKTNIEVTNPVKIEPVNAPVFKLNEVLYSAGNSGAAVFSQPDTSTKYLLGSIPKYNAIGLYKGVSNSNNKMALVEVMPVYGTRSGKRYITFSQLSNIKP